MSTISSADCLCKLNHAQKVGQLCRSSDVGFTLLYADPMNTDSINIKAVNSVTIFNIPPVCSKYLMSQKAQKDPLNETVFPTPYFGFSAPFCVQVMSACGTDRLRQTDAQDL